MVNLSQLRIAARRRPLLAKLGGLARRLAGPSFAGTGEYWERRYRRGQTSGDGSVGPLALHKAEVLNRLVAQRDLDSVIEFGCGDGRQLALAQYPNYIGLDVAPTAVRLCKDRFADDATKSFYLFDATCCADRRGLFQADLSLSIDVIYHLVEEETYAAYLTAVFAAARRYVAIYSSNRATDVRLPHVRHRVFTEWVERNQPAWRLVEHIPNPFRPEADDAACSLAEFFVYER